MPRFTFYPIGDENYLVVAIAALVMLGLLLVGPARSKVSGRRRLVLLAIRAGVIALVLLAMLRPTLVYTSTTKQPATLVFMFDRTRSMNVPDEPAGRTRWESLKKAVNDAKSAIRKLGSDFEIRAYEFDSEVVPVDVDNGEVHLSESADGQQTALGAMLDEVLRREAGKRLLGGVLLSDGAQRAIPPRDLLPQTAASQYRMLGFPLYTFRFGKARGLGQAQDVAITDLRAAQRVFVKNELPISGEIRVAGYVNRKVTVRLLVETSPGHMEPVDQKKVEVMEDGQRIPIEFRYVPQVPGEIKLALEADAIPGELVSTNNRLGTYVNVLAGGLNVLYLEGALRREVKFLRWALDASQEIEVDYIRFDTRAFANRPTDLIERFQPGRYAIFILGDLDVSGFRDEELNALTETVSNGAGLIMLGGFQSFGPGGYAGTPLADVLPLVLYSNERQNMDEPVRDDRHWPGPLQMEPTPIGLSHFTLMLAGNRQASRKLWSQLPPLSRANRFDELKPGAMVLAEADAKRPLLVAQVFGAGRVMAFAGDSTWRWRMHGYEKAHQRFWRQIVLWLARRDQSREGSVWVQLRQRRFEPGSRVTFEAGAQSPSGEPVEQATFESEVELPDGSVRPLTLVHGQSEQRTGSIRETQQAGDYTIRVTASKDEKILGTSEARFLVHQQDLELDNASADATLLDNLASTTKGESLPPEELSELLQRISEEAESLEDTTVTRATLWDKWYLLIFLVALLGVEWYLRKRWSLV